MSPGLPPGRAGAPGVPGAPGASAAGGPDAKVLDEARQAALAQAAARLSTDRFQPTTRRQRLVIMLVTVVVVVGLWGLLIFRPGGTYRDLAACSPGQLQGCVGGLAEVMLLPPTGAASLPAGLPASGQLAEVPAAGAASAAMSAAPASAASAAAGASAATTAASPAPGSQAAR